ncbi:MAG: Ig-like domain-containing protein, partial [Rubripirellula sp.]
MRNRLLYEVLEERRVLDGAPVITVDSLVTNDATPKLTGTIEGAADSIEITVGGQTLPASQTGTTWELADNSLTALLEGTYDVVASASNSSGTGTDNTTNELTIDLTAPNAPTALDLAASSDSGSSDVDDITADTTPLITGVAEAGSLVELFDTDGVTSLGTANAAGDGSWSISSSSLSDGAHTLSAVATDLAGNVSSSSAGLAISIDTTAPTVEADVQFVNDNTPAVSGTVNENDAELVITVAGQT